MSLDRNSELPKEVRGGWWTAAGCKRRQIDERRGKRRERERKIEKTKTEIRGGGSMNL
jgi:hypothetical protein